jgi:hypothetical protein
LPAIRMLHNAFSVLLLATIGVAGCAADPQPPPPPPADAALKEIVPVYKYLEYSKAPPPKRLEDLNQYIDSLPSAYYRLQSGDFELVYGVGMAVTPPAAHQVLAYEKKALTEGGAVLLRDGTVKNMTAEEFNAAPKAK